MLNLPPNPQFCQTDVSGSTFVNADCFDVFPFIEDKSIDAIICDLPYGTTACKWDVIIPFDKLWEQYERIIKPNGAIVLTASQPFTSVLIMSNMGKYKYNWTWNKKAPYGFAFAKHQPLRVIEDIVVFNVKNNYNPQMTLAEAKNKRPRNKKYIVDGDLTANIKNRYAGDDHNEDLRYPINYIEIRNDTAECNKLNRIHPTQKPIELMEYLVKTYTNEGDMVLDNTMGSGTTNLACIKLNRKSIGIEKEKQYYDVAVRRASEYCH
jgi:site-specific DNA-methyltransferase (adenine-specific)